MISLTTRQIAELVDGELHGADNITIEGVGPLESAAATDLSFVARPKMHKAAAESKAGAILTAQPVEGFDGVQIVCADPELAIVKLLGMLRKLRFPHPEGISRDAFISPKATIGRNVAVGAGAVVEDGAVLGDDVIVYPLSYIGRDVHVGARTVVYARATVCARVEMGKDCILHPGSVVGSEGFGFIQRDGASIRLPHVASVRLGNAVEVGPNACVDRGMLDDTVIGDDVKLDNHCNVAHNCRVGEHSIMAGYARLAGSVTVGKGVVMAADSRVVDHLTIGDGATLGAGATAVRDVPAGATVLGTPAVAARQELRKVVLIGKLPEMHKTLIKLQKEVTQLREQLHSVGEGR